MSAITRSGVLVGKLGVLLVSAIWRGAGVLPVDIGESIAAFVA